VDSSRFTIVDCGIWGLKFNSFGVLYRVYRVSLTRVLIR
jgi:hypothetical protein